MNGLSVREKLIERLLLVLAFSAVSVLALITVFIFQGGVPVLVKYGLRGFVFGMEWLPREGKFGILPMIVGSLWVTFGALVLGVPLGLGCAVFLAEFAPARVARLLKAGVELLAGIPSVVYGFVGVMVLVPLIREYLGGPGMCVLAGSVILSVMILPTIISISVDALRAVPPSYREGSLALGANRWQTTYMVVLPAARSGILAAIILGMGRAIGETMAVIMVAGNAVTLATWVLQPTRTLTSNIALELSSADGEHRQALFATGVMLFIFIMILNVVASRVTRRRVQT